MCDSVSLIFSKNKNICKNSDFFVKICKLLFILVLFEDFKVNYH